MEKGRIICTVLKGIRQKIANENGISYQPEECHHKGECTGTCPACEKEIRYLEEQLDSKHDSGLGLKVAGVAAGVCATVLPVTAMMQPDSNITPAKNLQTIKNDTVKVADLSNGHADAVLLSGQVLDVETKETMIGATVCRKGTTEGTVTNIDGLFALKVLPTDTLEAGFVGYKSKIVTVKQLLAAKDNTIYIEMDTTGMNDIIILGGCKHLFKKHHVKKGPKSHKEKKTKKK